MRLMSSASSASHVLKHGQRMAGSLSAPTRYHPLILELLFPRIQHLKSTQNATRLAYICPRHCYSLYICLLIVAYVLGGSYNNGITLAFLQRPHDTWRRVPGRSAPWNMNLNSSWINSDSWWLKRCRTCFTSYACIPLPAKQRLPKSVTCISWQTEELVHNGSFR